MYILAFHLTAVRETVEDKKVELILLFSDILFLDLQKSFEYQNKKNDIIYLKRLQHNLTSS